MELALPEDELKREESESEEEQPVVEDSLRAYSRRLLFEELSRRPIPPTPTPVPIPVLPPNPARITSPTGTKMSTTMKGTMPDPSSKKAPRFDKRKPAKLYGFFESFEEVAKGCGLDAKEMSKAVVRYTDEKTKRYWKTLDGYDKDFGQLKKSIVGTYSKTELEPSFSVKKLVKLVEKSAKARISKDDQLSEYNRNFGYLAGQLQAAR